MAHTLEFVVSDPVGLYASPVTELVNTVKAYSSHVTLKYHNKEVNLKSMMGVLSLGVPTKAHLEVVVDGEDEVNALEGIKEKIQELGIATIE